MVCSLAGARRGEWTCFVESRNTVHMAKTHSPYTPPYRCRMAEPVPSVRSARLPLPSRTPGVVSSSEAATPMTARSPASPMRLVEDRFVLLEAVGNGRMSTVYLARDRSDEDREVAVKILNTAHPDPIKRELFKRETTALRKLRHPNVIGLRESGWSAAENAFYIVMDHMPHSLDRCLAATPAPPIPIDMYRIMRDLADALANAHSEGVIHRDIKPSNVLLDSTGRALLTDFGISKLITDLTVGETLAGFWSNGYAAPEQRAGEPATFASDVYSLGAVYYRMLSGEEPPPEGPGASLVEDRVPRPFRHALLHMLAGPARGSAASERGADGATGGDPAATRSCRPIPSSSPTMPSATF